jgi:uncharacterized GH25 family protein
MSARDEGSVQTTAQIHSGSRGIQASTAGAHIGRLILEATVQKKRVLSLTLVLILTVVGTASAHYTFIMPEKFRVELGETLKIGFHSAEGFPESSEVGKRLQNALLHTEGRAVPISGLAEEGTRMVATITVPSSGHVVATVVNPAAIESMEAESFTKYLQEEGLGNIVDARAKSGETDKPARERYTMYAKTIMLAGAPTDAYQRPVGLPIEIIPRQDPYALKDGESLPVQVLFKGAPARDLEVMALSTAVPPIKARSIGRTDADGRIIVPIATGQWLLHTILMERSSQSDADWESYWAALTFEIR